MMEKSDDLEYLEEQGIMGYVDFSNSDKSPSGVFETVQKREEPYPPDPEDLARLHRLIRERMATTVLEFGVGYSSIVIADALTKNEARWESLSNKPDIRNKHMFELHLVDASQNWIEFWEAQCPPEFKSKVKFNYSPVKIDTYQGQMCHFYQKIPDIVPDFVYLDAPHPGQVEGELGGMTFDTEERTVMSADLLMMEPTLLPGTFILVDGRTNNARFLERNFSRKFRCDEKTNEDVTIFELDEEPLGKLNKNWPLINSHIDQF